MKAGYFHGYHVSHEATIDLLRLAGADEVSVIVHDNNRDIPAVRRLEEFSKAGYAFIPK
jgi:3,4-dihydroxy-2-butanone 4-phosphate synthase